jgi:hypothetical protein
MMKNHAVELTCILLLLVLAACGTPGGETVHRDPLTLQGASVDEVTKSLGPPQADDRLPTGERVLLYSWTSSYVTGGYTTTPDGQIYAGSNWNLPRMYEPTRTVSLSCVVRFTIGTDNRVNRVERHGEGC